jgi:hypothetical protein
MAAGCDPASAKPKNVVVDRKKSAGDAKLHCEINREVRALADFLRCGGSLSDFLYWRADATAIIGTLTQRTAVAHRNRGNFASLSSAQSALLILEDYGGLWGHARRGIVRLIVRLIGRFVAEIRPRIFAVCSEGQYSADGFIVASSQKIKTPEDRIHSTGETNAYPLNCGPL